MTLVILAREYRAAEAVAAELQMKRHQWIYPTRPEHLAGVEVDTVLYVDGWSGSRLQTLAVGAALLPRMGYARTLAIRETVRPLPATPFVELRGVDLIPHSLTRWARVKLWLRGGRR